MKCTVSTDRGEIYVIFHSTEGYKVQKSCHFMECCIGYFLILLRGEEKKPSENVTFCDTSHTRYQVIASLTY